MDENPVVHFEMPYKDAVRVSKFYEQAFGWKMNQTGEQMGNYIMVETTKTENGRPAQPGTVNGGLFPLQSDSSAQVPSVVIAVKNLQTALQHVKDAGGEVIGEPTDIPGIGKYVSFNDSEGNRVSLLQPLAR